MRIPRPRGLTQNSGCLAQKQWIHLLTCDWSTENNWWCPPIYLVSRVLRHTQNTKAKGTLIIAQWPSAPYWPLLFPNGWEPAEFVSDWLEEELF